MSGEADREALLKQAIERHADAWYGDGTQVGPMARAGRTLPNRGLRHARVQPLPLVVILVR